MPYTLIPISTEYRIDLSTEDFKRLMAVDKYYITKNKYFNILSRKLTEGTKIYSVDGVFKVDYGDNCGASIYITMNEAFDTAQTHEEIFDIIDAHLKTDITV